jgi:WhiB family redox-sensing transcriptional regulator
MRLCGRCGTLRHEDEYHPGEHRCTTCTNELNRQAYELHGRPDRPRKNPTLTEPATWRKQAACREMDTDMFFPDRGTSTADAKSVCLRCPVRIDCLTYSLEAAEKFGIFGGSSERQRRTLRTQMSLGLTARKAAEQFIPTIRERVYDTTPKGPQGPTLDELPPAPPGHGTNSMYTKYACRCIHCKAAHSAYRRDHRAQNKATA